MKEISLKIVSLLKSRLTEKKPLIQVILGPRQVGKTTAVQQFILKNHRALPALYVSAEGVDSSLWIEAQWQEAQFGNKILIIDEIQKIPNWSEMVKKLWDQDKNKKRPIKCVLLGSSSLSLNKGLTESLTGRFETIQMYHWGFSDTIKLEKMSLENFFLYGGYPGSYRYLKDLKRWSEYMAGSIVETVIGKDILTQAQVRSPALFRQSFYLFAGHPAQVVSYNKLLGQLQDKGNIDLIKYYAELFEAAFLFKFIHKFTNNELRKNISSPKIIPMAPALSIFFRIHSLGSEDHGRIFEACVGAELIKAGLDVFYWADNKYEVDFVVRHKNHIFAIEVKSGRNKASVSLEKFRKKYPSSKIIFITKENFVKFASHPIKYFEALL